MKISLKGDDAALIFRASGEREAAIAAMPASGMMPDNVMLMSAVLARLKSEPAFEQEMRAWIAAQALAMQSKTYN